MQLGALLGTVYIVQEVDQIFMTTQGGPGTLTTNLPYYVYETAIRGSQVGRGAAIGVMVVVLTIIAMTVLLRVLDRMLRAAMQAAKRPAIAIPTRRHPGRAKQGAPVAWAILAWVVGLIVFFPAFYIVATGFKSEATAVQLPPKFIPLPGSPRSGLVRPFVFDPTFEQYREIKSRGLRTLLPAIRSSPRSSRRRSSCVLAVPAAYALALAADEAMEGRPLLLHLDQVHAAGRHHRPALHHLQDLHLLNTIQGLVIMYTAMNLPIAIWMLRSFFEEVPRRRDRCRPRRRRRDLREMIADPVADGRCPGSPRRPSCPCIFAWNEFFFAVNLVATEKAATVPLFMQKFITSEGLFWAKLSAASTMAIAPVVLLGWISQRQLVRGLSMGAVK